MVEPFELLSKQVNISPEVFDKLSLYHDLLIQWQPNINLVSPASLKEAWHRHFLDSLQLLPHVSFFQETWDIGSGAGFPGLVLAIAGVKNVRLIDSDAKKIAFLREVLRITQTEARVECKRVEETTGNPDLILARAMAPLDKLLDSIAHLVSHETTCLFPKGKNYSKEIEEASEHWSFDVTIIPSVTDPEGAILKLSHIGKKHDQNPGSRQSEGRGGQNHDHG